MHQFYNRVYYNDGFSLLPFNHLRKETCVRCPTVCRFHPSLRVSQETPNVFCRHYSNGSFTLTMNTYSVPNCVVSRVGAFSTREISEYLRSVLKKETTFSQWYTLIQLRRTGDLIRPSRLSHSHLEVSNG